MARIFISYKRVDKDKVFKIKDQIESELGEKCWIDLDGIESDAQFKNVIIKAINECQVVLFMYSKVHADFTDFEKDWTIRELNFAAKKRKRIVFINLDGSPLTDTFEFDFGAKQQVDGRSKSAIKKLCLDISHWDCCEIDSPTSNTNSADNTVKPSHFFSRNYKLLKALTVIFIMIVLGGLFLPLKRCAYNFTYDDYSYPDTLLVNGLKLVMMPIRGNDTIPGYYLSQTEVTQSVWKAVMGNNPSYPEGDMLPVSNVSWYDCIEFCLKLSERTGLEINLPTSDQWQFAAVAGDTVKYAGSDSIDVVAWYTNNSHYAPHYVAQKKPNAYGLYDMSGNICEWCLDSLPQSSLMRVIMGGCNESSSYELELGHLDYDYSFHCENRSCHHRNGFRICMKSKNSKDTNSYHTKNLQLLLLNKSRDESLYQKYIGIRNGHEWIDLGLPSNTKWATKNIGAADEEQVGHLYVWGETTFSDTREYETGKEWQNCRWVTGGSSYSDQVKFSKYVLDPRYGKVDGKTDLEPEDDAAFVNWGDGWRTPNYMQIKEIVNNCLWIWSTRFGHHGYKVIGRNGMCIFLPEANTNGGGWFDYYDNVGVYMSRTQSRSVYDSRQYVHYLEFHDSYGAIFTSLLHPRYSGVRVRPILEY